MPFQERRCAFFLTYQHADHIRGARAFPGAHVYVPREKAMADEYAASPFPRR
jgi:glyoxylase-like metal-dependent hydrolase (beta-lactamase superfamily II)